MAPAADPVFPPDVVAAMELGSRGPTPPNPSWASFAALSQSQISDRLGEAGYKSAVINMKQVFIGMDYVQADYTVDLKLDKDTTSPIIITILHCGSFNAAYNAMALRLTRFDQDVSTFAKPTTPRYGNTSLQTINSVFWQHLRHFVNVQSGAQKPDASVLDKIAAALDAWLLKYDNSDPSKLPKPTPTISPSSMTVTQGQSFTPQLANITNCDPTKTYDLDKPELLFAIDDPSSNGRYNFFAQQPGLVNISLMVAHVDYLTPAAAKLTVTIQ